MRGTSKTFSKYQFKETNINNQEHDKRDVLGTFEKQCEHDTKNVIIIRNQHDFSKKKAHN